MTLPSIEPHPGPTNAPAASAGTGLRSAECLRYRISGKDAQAVELALPWSDDRLIGPGSMLEWLVLPAFDESAEDVRDGFRATATAVDLEFDDGTRLLRPGLRERDGTAANARHRLDIDLPDQWNLRRIRLDDHIGRRVMRAALIIDPGAARGATATMLEGWLDGLRIVQAAEESPSSPAERVMVLRGSHSSPWRSRGNTAPMIGVPNGAVCLAPATDLGNPHWTYSWNAHGPGHRPHLAGMLLTRSPSIWIGDRGAMALRVGLEIDDEGAVLAEEFDHDDEQALPHRYRVRTRSGIAIDGAATAYAAVLELEMPSSGHLQLSGLGAALQDIAVVRITDEELLVSASATTPSPHERDPLRGYASLRLLGPLDLLDPIDQPGPIDQAGPLDQLGEGGALRFSLRAGATGTVRVEWGASLISLEHAERARSTDIAGRPLAEIAEEARASWDALLCAADAPEADAEERALIASDLYRLFLYPTRHHERGREGAEYVSPLQRIGPDGPDRTGRAVRRGHSYTGHGFWDTYRTAWPAYHLLAPLRAAHLLDGLLEQVRESGWSARWTAGTPLDAMVGTSLDIITADAVASGVPGVDARLAYRAALRNATAASDDPRFGRKGMPQALFRGYVDAGVPESVSWTLEGAINDAGAAVLARFMASTAPSAQRQRFMTEARYLAARALDYASLWDAQTGFFRPRHADGSLADEPFDPRLWGSSHTETNAWGSRFGISHDAAGLAALHGGPSGLRQALDAMLAEPETGRLEVAGGYGEVIHEMPEARDIRRGMWAPSNQPAHHVPWLFAHTDRPWRSSEIILDAVERLFLGAAIGQGFPGDEDNGEMSAWRLFGVLGLAPFRPGSGELLLGVPAVERLRLQPDDGGLIEIRAPRRSRDHRHLRAVRIDGESWTGASIPVSRLREGALLELELGTEAVAWAEPISVQPFFAPDKQPLRRLRDIARNVRLDDEAAPALLDDAGASSVRLAVGSVLEVQFEPAAVRQEALLTLSLAHPGRHRIRIEMRTEGAWRAVTVLEDERWDWPRQTRPFALGLPADCDRLRLCWDAGDAELQQLQLLVPRDD